MSWGDLLDQWRNKLPEGIRPPLGRGFLFRGVIVFAAVLLLFAGIARAKKTVVVVDGGNETALHTCARTVDGALKAAKVTLQEKDEVVPSPDSPLKNGTVITINRAADVKIAVDGQEIAARTRGATVADLLTEYGISLGPEDEVTPAADTPVQKDMTVRIARVVTKTEYVDAVIEFETKRQYTTKLPEGSTRVARDGREGTERQTWQVTFRDGREASRKLASREVVVPPVDRIVLVGSSMVSRGGENIRYSEAIDMIASAYTYTGYNTASGVPPHYGVAAVDPGRIPMGTRLYVEGYGYVTALDRGSAISGNRIDLFFESYEEAMSWGVRRVKVYVLD
ncbi:MAG TPA: ubiquitin-like domain-containing protein [Bacillota bacterium]|nr:ubiquitin-like domain-containing protein [Bacillota bacterium]